MVSDGVSLFSDPVFTIIWHHVIPSQLLLVLEGYGLSFSFRVGIGFALSYFVTQRFQTLFLLLVMVISHSQKRKDFPVPTQGGGCRG